MQNVSKIRGVGLATIKRDRDACAAVRLGWMDAMYGRPFTPEYERAADAWQRNYATARQAVAHARSQRRMLPGWPTGAAFPDEVARIIAEAQVAGSTLPPVARRASR